MNTSNRISDILGELCGNPQTAEQDEQLHQAEQAIQQLLDEAYKKGYIDGGIKEITK